MDKVHTVDFGYDVLTIVTEQGRIFRIAIKSPGEQGDLLDPEQKWDELPRIPFTPKE